MLLLLLMKEIISKERTWLISNPIPNTSTSCNKDLNGGHGTWDQVGNNLLSKFIARLKKKNIKIPVICLGYISSILESKGINTIYTESLLNSKQLIQKEKIECVLNLWINSMLRV